MAIPINCGKSKKIATVSFFTKNQIVQTYHINPDRITVIYSSWLHLMNQLKSLTRLLPNTHS